jgi:hypothetical protein
MLYVYNILRFLSRATAAGVISTLFTGKAEPFGMKFEGPEATGVAITLGIFSIGFFIFESAVKKKAGL